MKPDIASVWLRVEAHAGDTFEQLRGATFTYRVVWGRVVPDRTVQQISKSHFARALELVPLSGPGEIQPLRVPRTSTRSSWTLASGRAIGNTGTFRSSFARPRRFPGVHSSAGTAGWGHLRGSRQPWGVCGGSGSRRTAVLPGGKSSGAVQGSGTLRSLAKCWPLTGLLARLWCTSVARESRPAGRSDLGFDTASVFSFGSVPGGRFGTGGAGSSGRSRGLTTSLSRGDRFSSTRRRRTLKPTCCGGSRRPTAGCPSATCGAATRVPAGR